MRGPGGMVCGPGVMARPKGSPATPNDGGNGAGGAGGGGEGGENPGGDDENAGDGRPGFAGGGAIPGAANPAGAAGGNAGGGAEPRLAKGSAGGWRKSLDGARKMPLRFDGDAKPAGAGASGEPPKARNMPVMGPALGRGVGDDGGGPGASVGGMLGAAWGAATGAGAADADAAGAPLAMNTKLHFEQRTRMGPAASLSSPTLKRVLHCEQVMITRVSDGDDAPLPRAPESMRLGAEQANPHRQVPLTDALSLAVSPDGALR